ncbi:MAG: SDR family oxidoreductase [Gammaproteobacteria bacterium]|nr:SDR family oxidoreductase [Chromatiales bacterium]MYE49037.1 SDR family oxidoreductase [Gammaproteobacteria bacterium]
MSLKNETVAIIGGSRGIGLGVAEAAKELGAAVTIISRNPQAAADKLGVACLSTDARSENALRDTFAQLGEIDHLVCTQHNAQTDLLPFAMTSLDKLDLEKSKQFMLSKYWSQFMSLQIGAPNVKESGSITLTSGVAGSNYLDNHSVIGPNNCAINGLALYGARELAPKRVNVVSPGLVHTPLYDDIDPHLWEHLKADFEKLNPVGWVAEPEHIAAAYIFVLTSPYLTGTVIPIDGGFLTT